MMAFIKEKESVSSIIREQIKELYEKWKKDNLTTDIIINKKEIVLVLQVADIEEKDLLFADKNPLGVIFIRKELYNRVAQTEFVSLLKEDGYEVLQSTTALSREHLTGTNNSVPVIEAGVCLVISNDPVHISKRTSTKWIYWTHDY